MLTVQAALPRLAAVRARPGDPDLVDHRADHGLPRLVALRRHARRPSSASCGRAAIELAPMRITVNAVLPGNVATEGLDELGEDYRADDGGVDPAGPARQRRGHRQRRLFFATDEAAYITGQAIASTAARCSPSR